MKLYRDLINNSYYRPELDDRYQLLGTIINIETVDGMGQIWFVDNCNDIDYEIITSYPPLKIFNDEFNPNEKI